VKVFYCVTNWLLPYSRQYSQVQACMLYAALTSGEAVGGTVIYNNNNSNNNNNTNL